MMWLVFQTDPYCCSADYRAVNHLKRRWLIASSQGHFCSDKIIYFCIPQNHCFRFQRKFLPFIWTCLQCPLQPFSHSPCCHRVLTSGSFLGQVEEPPSSPPLTQSSSADTIDLCGLWLILYVFFLLKAKGNAFGEKCVLAFLHFPLVPMAVGLLCLLRRSNHPLYHNKICSILFKITFICRVIKMTNSRQFQAGL